MKTSKTIATVSAVTLIATAGLLFAGPLNPPAGPVTSTMKTLTEVEPRIAINSTNTPGDANSVFQITQSGSYYLTGNVTGAAGKHGIEIAAANVTLDLNGFNVQGSADSLSGIVSTSAGVTVKNGTVRGWDFAGVTLGPDSHVKDVTARLNGTFGLYIGTGGIVESCTAASNGNIGIRTLDSGAVRNCTATLNAADGISLGASSRVEHCVATGNGGVGIDVNGNSVAAECTSDVNALSGFSLSDQSSIHDCSASGNGSNGIEAAFGVHVARCTVYSNINNGISCGAACRIEGNNCRFNGNGPEVGAGILVITGSNRTLVSNNTVINSDFGIKVDAPTNLVIGNTVGVNSTNYEIVSGNRVGIILTLPTSGAISGNTGGTTITSPDANFVY